MALFDFFNRTQTPLKLPDAPCGQCSGVSKYNNQLPEDTSCDYSGSRPVSPPGGSIFNDPRFQPQPGYDRPIPQPVSPTSRRPPSPSTIPPIVGQFDPIYLNPPDHLVPNFGQPSNPTLNPFGKPCPRDINPQPTFPKAIRKPEPQPRQTTDNHPCDPYNPNTWNNTLSKRLPLISQGASGNMQDTGNPWQPQFRQPDNPPPILQSGKRRDVRTPDELCIPDGSATGYHYQQFYNKNNTQEIPQIWGVRG